MIWGSDASENVPDDVPVDTAEGEVWVRPSELAAARLEDDSTPWVASNCSKLTGSILAALGPLPSAGTEPICFDSVVGFAVVVGDWIVAELDESEEVISFSSADCEASAAKVD